MVKKEKLWTPGFLILWQSQLVSTVGDIVYSISLGFWVLSVTGSTALMGALMAVSTLPGILISPFAGVLIDRANKKKLLIFMDILRGVCVVLLAAAAYSGLLEIWMVFAAGVILSTCGAVFNPGVQSSIPDLVPTSRVTNANAVFSIVSTGANLIGNAAGGFLYQILGAPLLFLLNGLTFLISGASLPFVKIPSVRYAEKPHFFSDMAVGFRYMWRQKGLRTILLIFALINFFTYISVTLFLPLCQFDLTLGSGRYGILMACFMGGAVTGYLTMSIISVKPKNKMKLFIIANVISNVLLVTVVYQPYFIVMTIMLALAGLTNSIFNVLLISTVQMSTPQVMRGKVMSFMNTTSGGLVPFAMALGGVLGGLLPLRLVMAASFLIAFLVTIPAYFSKPFREYLTTDTTSVPDA